MLGNLRISYKLLIMIGLSVLGIAAVAGVGLSALWSNLMEDRRAKLQDVVLLARQALDLNYQASRQAGLSEAEALERGKVLLRTFRFGKDDYFYAINAQGIAVANPNPKVEGKNLYDAADSDGVFFVRKQLEQAANGGVSRPIAFPAPQGVSHCRNSPTPSTSSRLAGWSAGEFILTTSMRSFGIRRVKWGCWSAWHWCWSPACFSWSAAAS
jgi:methyl-accepting chemotaxis protein